VTLAAEVTDEASDSNQLLLLIERTDENLAAAGIDDTPDT